MANSDYTAALNYFQLAKNEGYTDSELDEMILIVEKYTEAESAFNEVDMDGTREALESIPESYKNYSIASDIDQLKTTIESAQEKIDAASSQKEAVYVAPNPPRNSVPAKASNTNVVATYYVVNCNQSITLRTSASEITKIPAGAYVTVDGRDVCDIIVGDQQSDNQILIMGAMHAREYITAQIVMRQLCDYLSIVSEEADGEYNSISKKALSEGITVHFIPMSNPDGVSISQFGLEGIANQSVRDFISSISNGDYEQWKSNAEGIDLNRNFNAGWDEYIGSAGPSSDKYKGKFPGSSYEAAGLIKLTEEYGFKRTISYHTCGALIYWYYKQIDTVLEQSKLFAQQISDETGYTLDSNYQAVDAAGYKDWAVYKMGIPSITIEVGNETGHGIINPVPISFFDSIWDRNKDVVYAAIYNLKASFPQPPS
ncbi:MAG: M14 family zinc carboxypeptidase [Clostridiales bacterium]|nr:M14 family zinc carboxypeptidase [Clostridiales bacterium]